MSQTVTLCAMRKILALATLLVAITSLLIAVTSSVVHVAVVVEAAPQQQQIASTSTSSDVQTTTTTTTPTQVASTGAPPPKITTSTTFSTKTNSPGDKNDQSSGLPLAGKSNNERLLRQPANTTADLTRLINETLVINNKTLDQPISLPKDDWTFDMVEYDLMEFLQDLGARYQSSAGAGANKSAGQADESQLMNRSDNATDKSTSSEPTLPMKAHMITDTIVSGSQAPPAGNPASASGSSEPPTQVSTADNLDHAIAESSWQYGIFDRFTRARTTTTTPVPSDLIPSNFRPHVSMDVKDYNHNECGLRTYELDDETRSAYPQQADDGSQQAAEQAIKELKQRRQRPPPFSTLLGHHRKQHHPSQLGLASSSPSSSASASASSSSSDLMSDSHSSSGNADAGGYSSNGAYGDDQPAPPSVESIGDNEFNLSSRRQWLQQQLGNTLQVLGYNSTSALQQLDNIADLNELYNNSTAMSAVANDETAYLSSQQSMKTAAAAATAKAAKATHLKGTPIYADELAARQDELKLEARVIGGSDARLGDSPWSVSLQALVSRPGTGGVEYRHYCGGTIISEYYVLTAAHCLDFMVGRESRLFVVVGDLNWRMSAASVYGRRFGIEKLIIHSGYKSTAFGHDIGLIRTKESMRPLKAGGRYIINSVCLPERNVEHTGEAELVGWGLFSNRNEMADALQIVDVPILPRPLCVDLYRRRTGLIQWLIGIELITDKQVCAGTFGRGICQGDSGSALVHNERVEPKAYLRGEDSIQAEGKAASSVSLKAPRVRESQMRATIIGTVAFGGIRRCSYQSLPGVYMQTSKYMDWILPRIQM